MPRGSRLRPANGTKVLGMVAGAILVLALVVTGRVLSGAGIRPSVRPTASSAAPAPYRVGDRLACPHTTPVLASSDGRSYPLGHPARPPRDAVPVACYGTVAEAAAAGYEDAPLPAGALQLPTQGLHPVGGSAPSTIHDAPARVVPRHRH